MTHTRHFSFDPSACTLEQLDALLRLLQPLVSQLEDAYHQALLIERQYPLPGITQRPDDTPFNDPLPF